MVLNPFLYLSTTDHDILASLIDFRGKGLEIPKISLGTVPIIQSGLSRELEGPKQGKIYVMTALIEYLIVLSEYIDFLGALKQSGAQGKMPQLPAPSPHISGLEYSQLAIVVLITLLLYGEPLHSW